MSYPIPLMIADHTFGKNVSLIDFAKLVCRSAFSGSQSWLIWKHLLGIKFLNIKQCPAELSSRIIRSPPVSHGPYPPSYQKIVKLSGFEVVQNEVVNFHPPKNRSYYERVIYDCWLSLYFQIQETLQFKIYPKVTSFNIIS